MISGSSNLADMLIKVYQMFKVYSSTNNVDDKLKPILADSIEEKLKEALI
jgi:hypothetical protein